MNAVRITVILKPFRLEQVKAAVADLGATGITVQDVRGRGNSEEGGRTITSPFTSNSLPVRSKLTVVVPEEMQEQVIASILEHGQTGESGDGKIFVERVIEAVRIRTGERGDSAV